MRERVKRSSLTVLCCIVGMFGTGCALAAGALIGVGGSVATGLDNVVYRSGPTMDTTYQADVPTVAGLVSRVVTDHTTQSQFTLTKSVPKDGSADRDIELNSIQGSRLVVRVQDAHENGVSAARLQIWAHIDTDIKLIGANRKDMGAQEEFREIIHKLRQETAKRKLKVLRDTQATDYN